ncbi:MAG: response regulator transcription factor [Solirubrobacteraceae bacterium]
MSTSPFPVADRRADEQRSASPLRVAIIDTDSGFLQVLTKRMSALGWEHRTLASAVAPDALVSLRLNAVVLNLAVLAPHGWAYLEQLTAAMPALSLVVCTGPSTVAQRVRGLRLGADDWVTKPCHPEELIARVEAVARRRKRAQPAVAPAPVESGGISIRADQFQAFAGLESLDLTRREFELINLLAAAAGRVLPREEIYQRVWGYAMAHGDRSVDVFVRKLRQKLERGSPDWRYIHTHFGVGYRFAAEPAGGSAPSQDPVAADAPGAPFSDHEPAGRDERALATAASSFDAP